MKASRAGSRSVGSLPELYLAAVAFFLHFAWEMWQIPFFEGMSAATHWDGVVRCTRATVGDVVITLIAFQSAAWAGPGRRWFLAPSRRTVGTFLSVGLVITLGLEELSTGILARWKYSSLMPVLPVIGTGIVPLLQWVVAPLITLATLRKLALGDSGSVE